MNSPFGYGGSSETPFASGSGHEAGFRWAKDRGITQESELPQRAGSFRDGAAEYLRSLTNDPSALERSAE